MKFSKVSVFFSVFAVFSFTTAISAPIVLNGGDLRTIAFETSTNSQMKVASLPLATSQSAVKGGVSALDQYNFTQNGDFGKFEFDFTHRTSPVTGAYTQSLGNLYFVAGSDLNYELDGFYTSTSRTNLYLSAYLYDYNTASYVFNNTQYSFNSLNRNLALGQTQVGVTTTLTGSTKGNLVAGHKYQFNYNMYNWNAYGNPTSNSIGEINLNLIPEPSSLFLALFGLTMLFLGYRRKNK